MRKTLRHLKESSWLPIVQSLVVFVAGIVGGTLLEAAIRSIFDTATRVVLLGLFTVAVLSLLILLVTSYFGDRADKRETAWLNSFGVPAEIVFERLNESEGSDYRRLIEFVNSASGDDEILVMTQHAQRIPVESESDMHQRSREEYCEVLLRKAKEKGIGYRRIICFADPSNDFSSVLPWLLDHCRNMLELKKKKPDKISVKKSRKKIGADILVIPKKLGAIFIDIYDANTGVTNTNASLFFHNPPNKQVVDQLEEWFKENENDPETRSIESLPPTG